MNSHAQMREILIKAAQQRRNASQVINVEPSDFDSMAVNILRTMPVEFLRMHKKKINTMLSGFASRDSHPALIEYFKTHWNTTDLQLILAIHRNIDGVFQDKLKTSTEKTEHVANLLSTLVVDAKIIALDYLMSDATIFDV